MQPLTAERLAANAYRTLGISAAAGQAAIESAARRMRIWPDPARIPPTPWDLPQLGPISRSRSDIDHAVARLSEPASRLEDRLLWYHGSRPVAANNDGPSGLSSGIADRHDAAVAVLHAAIIDQGTCDIDRWKQAIERFGELSTSTDYVSWLADVEGAGQFDKRAQRCELEDAVQALPGAIVAALAPQAQAAFDRNDPETCAAILSLLREGRESPQAADAIRRLVHALEDVLDSHVREMDKALRDKLRTNHSAPQPYYAANFQASNDAVMFYNSTVTADLERLRMVAGDDEEVLTRANSSCSDVLTLLALGWEWSGRFILAEQTLEMALGLADGPGAKEKIQNDLSRIRPRAEDERRGVRPPASPRVTPRRQFQPSRGGWRVGTGVLVMLLVALSRIITSSMNSPSDSSPPPLRTFPLGNVRQSLHDVAAAKAAEETPPDPATLPRSQIDSTGETNREP